MSQTVGSVKVTAEADASGFGEDFTKAIKDAMKNAVAAVTAGMRGVNQATSNVDSTGVDAFGEAAQQAARHVADVGTEATRASDGVQQVARSAQSANTALSRIDATAITAITRNTEDAQQALGQLDRWQLDALVREANRVGQTLGEEVQAGASQAERSLRSLDAAGLDRVINSARDAQRELRQVGTVAGGTAADISDIGEEAAQAESRLGGLRGAASEAGSGISGAMGDAAGGIDVAGISVSDLGDKFKSLGPIAGAAAAAIGVAMAGITAAIDAEEMAAKFKVQFDLIGEEAVKANDIAKTVFRGGYGESMEEVLATVGQVHQSLANLGDSSPAEIEKLVKSADNLRAVFGTETQDSIQLVSQLVRNGLAKDATEGFDLVTTAFGRIPEAMRDELPDLINEYGTFFDSMGFSGQEAFGALIAASRDGQIAMDKMGDAIKEIGIRATDLGDQGAVDALDALGLAGENIQQRLLEGGETAGAAFKQINDALAAIPDDAKRAELGVALFGTPIEDLGKNKIPAFLESIKSAGKEMDGFEGSAARADETLSTTGFKLTQIGRTIQGGFMDGLKIVGAGLIEFGGTLYDNAIKPFGEQLAPAFNKAKEILSDVWENTIKPIFKELEPQIKKLGPAFELLGKIVGFVFSTIGSVIEVAWDIIAPILRVAFTIIGELIGFIGDLAGFLLDIPGAIGDAFGALGDFLHGIGENINEFISGIPEFLGDLAGTIGDWFAEQWASFTEFLGETIDTASTFFTELPGKIIGWAGDVGAKFVEWFTAGWEFLTSLAGGIVDGIQFIFIELPGKIVGWAGDLAGRVRDWFSQQWENFKTGLPIVIDTVSTFFTELPGKIIGWLGNVGSMLIDAGKNMIDGLIQGLRNAGGAVKDFLIGLMTDAKDAVLGFFGIQSPSTVFADIGKNLMLGLAGGIEKDGSKVTDAMLGVAQGIAATDFSVTGPTLTAAPSGPGEGFGSEAAPLDTEAFTRFGDAAAVTADELVNPAIGSINDALVSTGDTLTTVTNDQLLPSLTAVGETAIVLADEQVNPALTAIGAQAQLLASTTDSTILGQMIPTTTALGDAIQRTQAEGIQPAFNAISGGLSTVQTNFGNAVSAIGTVWDGLRGATARPVNFMLGTVWNQGLFPAWNKVAEFLPDMQQASSVATIPGYRTGGELDGPGTGTSDSILMWGSKGEHMVTALEVIKAGGQNVLYAIRDMISRGVPFTWDNGKVISTLGRNNLDAYGSKVRSQGVGEVNPEGLFDQLLPRFATGGAIEPWMVQLQKGHEFARAQHGKPYQWAGPNGVGSSFDCSGFMGSIAAAILGSNPWQRYWATASFAGYPPVGPQGFTKGGDNGFTIGVTDDPGGPGGGHTAGTLGALPDMGIARAVNVESGGALGDVHYGGGTDPSTFASMYRLPIGANGFFVGGGAGPTPEEMRQFLKDKTREVFDEIIDPIRASMPYAPPPELLRQPSGYLEEGDKQFVAELGSRIDGLSTELAGAWVKASNFNSATVFDTGGVLRSGEAAVNRSGQPERVLSPQQTQAFDELVTWLTGGRLAVDWGGIEDLIRTGIDVYQQESAKTHGEQAETTKATQQIARDIGANGAVGKALTEGAALSTDLLSVLDTSGLFSGRTVTATAEEVRKRQEEEFRKFLENLRKWMDEGAKDGQGAKDPTRSGKTFDLGGVISGPGMFASGTLLPERVLSPAQTQAFDRLVTGLTGPQLAFGSAGAEGRGGARIGRQFNAGDIHQHFPNVREPERAGKAAENHLLELLNNR